MAGLDSLLRFWRAIDGTFEKVTSSWWGAVVTDRRFPDVWDLNYARVETDDPDLRAADIEADLLPDIERSGARNVHIVVFHPEQLTRLIAELSTRGDKITWDTVMRCVNALEPKTDDAPVEEVLGFDDAFWARHRESLRAFDVVEPDVVEELVRLERDHLLRTGKRWFTIRENGVMVAFASLQVLEGVGYLDHVMTFPEARGRGYASSLVRRVSAESRVSGVQDFLLLAEQNGTARTLYERLGFETVGHLAASLRRRS